MARLFYMSLPGIGDWSAAMLESGAQLAPYRSYLVTAKNAADNRALSVSWRTPKPEELRQLNARFCEGPAEARGRSKEPQSRRDRRGLREAPSGVWVILEPRPGYAEEPETTFDAFLQSKDVYDRPPIFRGGSLHWQDECKNEVRTFDREGLALLLARAPTPIPPAASGSRTARAAVGPLLFLCPNTWPLICQRLALESLEGRPAPRVAPLLRLVSTRPAWANVARQEVPEDAWVFLRAGPDALRDGTVEQREFVRRSLGTPDFAVLEGPPGSGKTTAICELIVQLTRARKRVLLVASTHVAVDNVLERLIEWQDGADEKVVMPIRIGDENSVTSNTVKAWTLRNLERTWSSEILDHLDRPRAAEADEGAAARLMLKGALTRKGKQSALAQLLLDASNLVCGTTIGILQHPAIKASRKGSGHIEPFDFLILDEASKTTFTEFLVPATYARRWVVVGDRRQLSPYVDEQDLAENLRGLLPTEVSRATVHAFVASSAVSDRMRVRSLVAVGSKEEAQLMAYEAEARGVAAVDLDRLEPAPLYGIEGACAELLCADIVFGKPETIAAWEHRLPGDLRAVDGAVPNLQNWEAHRRALRVRPHDGSVAWADEVAWRQIRAYELRHNQREQKRLLDELDELRPKTLAERFRAHAPSEALAENLDNMRRVSMPSILEILQVGAGSRGWKRETALTVGLPPLALRERMVSLSFQHRMHPEISAFPRTKFYGDADLLKDAATMLADREWAYPRYARRAVWIDIPPRRQGRAHQSFGNSNPAESDAVMRELQVFVKWALAAPHPGKDRRAPWEVAVLTFYRGQEKLLRRHLQDLSGQRGNTRNFHLPRDRGGVHVTLCTVDSFQGHEADLVLLSFVKSGTAGFLNSPNRLNVALTRARYQLVLIGHRSWMASSDCRSELLRDVAGSSLYAREIGWEDP